MEHLIPRTHKVLLGLILPKWPMMKVTGEKVTKKQAKEIIRRTDTFLHSPCPEYTNNFKWAKHVVDTLRLKHGHGSHVTAPMAVTYELAKVWKKEWGYIQSCYVVNDWIYSFYSGGPFGWCHPGGEIGYLNNVGKWPTIEGVYNDWVAIAKAFPFLELAVTLYNCDLVDAEEEEGIAKPVVSMFIFEGKVRLVDPIRDIDVHDLVVPHKAPEKDDTIPWDKEDGIGIPKEWIEDWANESRG